MTSRQDHCLLTNPDDWITAVDLAALKRFARECARGELYGRMPRMELGTDLYFEVIDLESHVKGAWPIYNPMRSRYIASLRRIAAILDGDALVVSDASHLSEIKGMFNRIVRRDQVDWCEVEAMLDYPPRDACRRIAVALGQLASVLREGKIPEGAVVRLHRWLSSQWLRETEDRIVALPGSTCADAVTLGPLRCNPRYPSGASWAIHNPLRPEYVLWLRRVAQIVTTGEFLGTDAECLSKVKGMFSRIAGSNQGDCLEIKEILEYPHPAWCKHVAGVLGDLSRRLRRGDIPKDEMLSMRGLLDPAYLQAAADRFAALPGAEALTEIG